MMKIIVTIGPNCDDEESLKEFSKKTNLFRLNGTHGMIEWHRKTASLIRKVCPDSFILMDIPGIKPRTSNSESIFNTSSIFGFLAISLASINIFGGFLVTQRMLAMYKKKKKGN